MVSVPLWTSNEGAFSAGKPQMLMPSAAWMWSPIAGSSDFVNCS